MKNQHTYLQVSICYNNKGGINAKCTVHNSGKPPSVCSCTRCDSGPSNCSLPIWCVWIVNLHSKPRLLYIHSLFSSMHSYFPWCIRFSPRFMNYLFFVGEMPGGTGGWPAEATSTIAGSWSCLMLCFLFPLFRYCNVVFVFSYILTFFLKCSTSTCTRSFSKTRSVIMYQSPACPTPPPPPAYFFYLIISSWYRVLQTAGARYHEDQVALCMSLEELRSPFLDSDVCVRAL